jgi:hypothetical protein
MGGSQSTSPATEQTYGGGTATSTAAYNGFVPMHKVNASHTRHTMPHRKYDEELELPPREGTAELNNDPRFFGENVLDKRLAAFEAVAIVTEILALEAVRQCYEYAELHRVGELWVVWAFQMMGFLTIVMVMFMNLLAASVLSLQLFFTIRLMTTGPTGFDKASAFYTDDRMHKWRERAIFCVKWATVLFMLASGLMLFVKFYADGAPEVVHEPEHVEEAEYQGHKILAGGILGLFIFLTAILVQLMKEHQKVFDISYASIEMIIPTDVHAHLLSTGRM